MIYSKVYFTLKLRFKRRIFIMTTNILIPNRFKRLGWIIFILTIKYFISIIKFGNQDGIWVLNNSLKVERAIKNLTQEQLAKLVGVSRQSINAIESGKYVPSTVLSLKLSKVFEKSVDQIFQLGENDWTKWVII